MSHDNLLDFLSKLPPDAIADFQKAVEADSEVGAASRTVLRALQEVLKHHNHPEKTHNYPDFFELVKAASDEYPRNNILKTCRAYLDAGESLPERLLAQLLSFLGEFVSTKGDVRHLMVMKGLGGEVPNYASPTDMWNAILKNTLQKKSSGSSQPTVSEGRSTTSGALAKEVELLTSQVVSLERALEVTRGELTASQKYAKEIERYLEVLRKRNQQLEEPKTSPGESSEILSDRPGPTFQKILEQALREFKYNENLSGFIRSIEQGRAPEASELIACMSGLFNDRNASKLFLQRVDGININIFDLPENMTPREYWTGVWNLCARMDQSAIRKPGGMQGNDAVKDRKIAALEREKATLKSDHAAMKERLAGLVSLQQQWSDRESSLLERERRLAAGESGLQQREDHLRRQEADLRRREASLNAISAPSFHRPKSGPEISEPEKNILNNWLTQNRDITRSQLPRQFPMEVIQILARHFPDINSIRALFNSTNDNDALRIMNASTPRDVWTHLYGSYKKGEEVNFVSLIQAVLKPLSYVDIAHQMLQKLSNDSQDIETLEHELTLNTDEPMTPQALATLAKHFGKREQMLKLLKDSGLLSPDHVPDEPEPRPFVTSIRRKLKIRGKWHDFLRHAIRYLEKQAHQG